MITEEEYNELKAKEAEFNKLFEKIITYTPFGQWYGYMAKASNMLTKNLPKRIAIDLKDGRPFVQYKGDMAKFAGVFGTATHKVIAEDLSKKKYGKALSSLLGVGHLSEMIKQTKKKGVQIFDISPDQVTELWKRKVAAVNPEYARKIKEAEEKDRIARENMEALKKIKKEKPKKLSFFQKLFRYFS